MKLWKEDNLKGKWVISYKIDGVNATWNEDKQQFLSRRGKPIHNTHHNGVLIGAEDGETYEVFCGDFKTTSSITRASKNPSREVHHSEMFDLEPELDPRLVVTTLHDPTATQIKLLFKRVLEQGYEGLVLRGEGGERLKVKNVLTFDLIVLDITEGNGRNKGRTGALVTTRGKVSGMSDLEREKFWEHGGSGIIGRMVECECMELTESGKMRHGRFIRIRDDKPLEENDDE